MCKERGTFHTDELPLPAPQEYALTLINSSENVGMAATLKRHLEKFGYQITALKSDFNETKQRSVVVYDLSLQEEALVLSKILNGALLSARPRSEKMIPKAISQFLLVMIILNP